MFKFISSITGKDITITINDIQKSVSVNLASDKGIETLRAQLLHHGFEEWMEEQEILYLGWPCAFQGFFFGGTQCRMKNSTHNPCICSRGSKAARISYWLWSN